MEVDGTKWSGWCEVERAVRSGGGRHREVGGVNGVGGMKWSGQREVERAARSGAGGAKWSGRHEVEWREVERAARR